MQPISFVILLIIPFQCLFYFGCDIEQTDDSEKEEPSEDSDDDDDNDDNNNDNDDNDTGPEHPYTPCCDVDLDEVVMTDPELPASGKGPFEFVIKQRQFIDPERDRSIKANIIFPSEDGENIAESGAPFPVVIVSHGFSGFIATVRPYGERLAQWGYIAIVPQLPFTSPLDLFKISHVESARDLLFILNTVCCEHNEIDSIFHERIDRARLGAVGHSMGGKISLLASLFDPALKAVMGLDPVDDSGPIEMNPEEFPSLTPELVSELQVPTLFLGGSESGIEVLGQACAPVDENYHEYWLFSPSPSVEITFVGADHTDFIEPMPLDICDVGYADHIIVKDLAKEYAVAFFNDKLRGWENYRENFAGTGVQTDEQNGLVTWQQK